MRKILYLTLALIPFILTSSCKKDENTNTGIIITPNDDYLLRNIGDIVNFTVKIESKDELVKFRVTQTINNSTTTIIDKPISGKKVIEWYDYEIPNEFEGYGQYEIKLIFTAYDNNGNSMNRAKLIYVNITENTLTEYGGNTMYSSNSNQFNAYDLLTNTPKYSSDTTSHIIDLSTSNPTDSLSKSWASPFGLKFVKHNSFDYSNATDLTVENAYNSGIKTDTIRNLAADDVILTKVENNYIVLKMTYVFDETGNINDKYLFSIKR